MSEILELPLASIEVGSDRARDLDPAWAEGLAGSIDTQGLMQPIVVRPLDGRYGLVAGLHRLEAFRLLGRETIPAVLHALFTADEAKLAEVMENLARNELIALGREIKWALNDSAEAQFADDPRLSGVYGTILFDDLGRHENGPRQRNITVFADRTVVMFRGEMVETGRTEEILQNPQHPYSRALIDCVPKIGAHKRRLASIDHAALSAGL